MQGVGRPGADLRRVTTCRGCTSPREHLNSDRTMTDANKAWKTLVGISGLADIRG